jgi:pyruvate/2-oxoglutarate dehydrogenase complex dihydrolipoamide dehydrogenase (E3) component
MSDTYDVIVVGAGPGGEVAAARCVRGGLSTVIVERELVGGECSYWGCMPSKGMLRPGDVVAAAGRVPGAREAISSSIDTQSALGRRDEITNGWDDKYQAQWLDDSGIDLVRGVGRLSGERVVEVEAEDGGLRRLTARKAVIVATGTNAAVPPIDGLRDIRIWDNRDVTAASRPPKRLLVLGGGAVGVEMAQAWRVLGVEKVTIVEASDRLLPMEEPFAGAQLRAAFESQGIVVLTGARMVAASRSSHDGEVSARLEDGQELTADEILVSVGRRARTADLGLDSVGLEPGRFVEVDDHLRASNGWLYAIGDVNGRAMFTHMAKYHGRRAADHILGGSGGVEERAVPRVVFTDPQIAAVGMTEQQARDAGISVGIARCDVSDVAGATVTGLGVGGPVQLVVDEDREVLVGATFLGPDVAEILHAATICIVAEVPLERLHHSVAAYPSLNEVWLKAIENYDLERENR